MAEDWSDAWLQKVAGWKAAKSGLAMAGSGLVKDANFDGVECRAIISGVKPRRVRVKRIDDTKAETFCYCAENQRTGAMCEHAVAAIILARGQGITAMSSPQVFEKKPTIVSKSTISKEDRQALRVELFPRWKDEWKAGRAQKLWSQPERLTRPMFPYLNGSVKQVFHKGRCRGCYRCREQLVRNFWKRYLGTPR